MNSDHAVILRIHKDDTEVNNVTATLLQSPTMLFTDLFPKNAFTTRHTFIIIITGSYYFHVISCVRHRIYSI